VDGFALGFLIISHLTIAIKILTGRFSMVVPAVEEALQGQESCILFGIEVSCSDQFHSISLLNFDPYL
jgi:hypothetical protein